MLDNTEDPAVKHGRTPFRAEHGQPVSKSMAAEGTPSQKVFCWYCWGSLVDKDWSPDWGLEGLFLLGYYDREGKGFVVGYCCPGGLKLLLVEVAIAALAQAAA